jgi:hypothetical protein
MVASICAVNSPSRGSNALSLMNNPTIPHMPWASLIGEFQRKLATSGANLNYQEYLFPDSRD